MTILLDTSVVVDYLRGKQAARDYINKIQKPLVSSITAAEIYRGARNKEDLKKLELTIERFEVLPINEPISNLALQLVRDFVLSHNLRILDALIAATALNDDLGLATLNIKHFEMIEELAVIRPY